MTHGKVKRYGIHRKSFKKRVLSVKSNGAKNLRSDFRHLAVGEMTDGLVVPRPNGCPSFAVFEARAAFSFFVHSFSFARERERTDPPEAPK